MKSSKELLQIAKIGKAVGLRGELKLHISSDFPEQFKKGSKFHTDKAGDLEVQSFDLKKGLISFVGFSDRDSALKLVNQNIFTTKEETVKNCSLEEDEFFWFEIIGSKVFQEDLELGVVKDIERLSAGDYLLVKTSKELVEKELPKSFYIPYIDRYIDRFDKEKSIVFVKDGFELLESS